jgi:hypothetical protein
MKVERATVILSLQRQVTAMINVGARSILVRESPRLPAILGACCTC